MPYVLSISDVVLTISLMCLFLFTSRLVSLTALLRHLISQVVIFLSRLLVWSESMSGTDMSEWDEDGVDELSFGFDGGCFCNFFSSSFARLWSLANNILFKASGSGFASFVFLSMYTINSSVDRTHPCLTPDVI